MNSATSAFLTRQLVSRYLRDENPFTDLDKKHNALVDPQVKILSGRETPNDILRLPKVPS
jgi:hypothetical protein